MKNFGLRLQELRTKKGLTQEEIGKLLNISQSAVAYYESGKKQPPLETLARLASFFGVSTDYLLGITDDPTATVEPKQEQKSLRTCKNS